MQTILKKAKFNDVKLKRLAHKITANELSKLSAPCYYPSPKKYYFQFLDACGLTDKDLKEFVKRFYKGTKWAGFQLHKDPQSNLYIIIMHYLLSKRDKLTYISMMNFYLIRVYSSRIRIQIKFCNPNYFRLALEKIPKVHLFAREKTIAAALYFLSKELIVRYTNKIEKAEIDGLGKFIQEARHRVAQSIKSFAETYYQIAEEGGGIKTTKDYDENENQRPIELQVIERGEKIITDIVKKMIVYKEVDKKAIESARHITKIKTSLAVNISYKLINPKYGDNITTILKLFVKELKSVKDLCGKSHEATVKRLLSLKRTVSTIYFKQQVEILLLKVLADVGYDKKYDKLSRQTQFLILSYLAFYLTFTLRNTIC